MTGQAVHVQRRLRPTAIATPERGDVVSIHAVRTSPAAAARHAAPVRAGRARLEALAIDHDAERVRLAVLDRPAEEPAGLAANLVSAARRDVVSFMRPGGPGTGAAAAWDHGEELLLARGVAVRSVQLESIRKDGAAMARARRRSALGTQIRTVPLLPLWLMVIDGEVAVVPEDPHDDRPGTRVVRDRSVAAAFGALFEHVWAGAKPLTAAEQGGGGAALTWQEISLLRLLADGHTDEVAARRLGVSARTVGRTVSDLMLRMGARSRFQAGQRVAELGWLSPATLRPPD